MKNESWKCGICDTESHSPVGWITTEIGRVCGDCAVKLCEAALEEKVTDDE